jgi:hypothetical protein
MTVDVRNAAGPTVETQRVLGGWDYACFGCLTALTWAALAWCLAAWVCQADWWVHPVLLGGMTLLLVYTVACQQFRWFLLLLMRRPAPMPPGRGGGWA